MDVQDDNLPKLIVTHSLTAGAGLTLAQFQRFVLQTQQQIELFVENVKLKGFLFSQRKMSFLSRIKSCIKVRCAGGGLS